MSEHTLRVQSSFSLSNLDSGLSNGTKISEVTGVIKEEGYEELPPISTGR